MATFRYIVRNVEESVAFYTGLLDFSLKRQFGPAMAIVARGDVTLWLAGPGASASRPMPDGRKPEPGGWNRMVIEVPHLSAAVSKLRQQGATFRNEIVTGPGGQQILCEDPSGNPIELFQAASTSDQ
jgi:catechol 2,3-dioxygenase-like lactoylglutathione lyase family enzyme